MAIRKAADLALYYYDGCPYCDRVRRVLRQMDVEVELRNIYDGAEHFEALVAARGRKTVPVLRIAGNERDQWMPESADIIAYLRRRFGQTP